MTARKGSIYATSDGQPITVVAIPEDTAIVDLNHPPGKHLVIDVEALRVEQPNSWRACLSENNPLFGHIGIGLREECMSASPMQKAHFDCSP